MIRRWFQQCEVVHGDDCRNVEIPSGPCKMLSLRDQTRFTRLLSSLYFIDTRPNWLAKMPSRCANCRYVALSYVWARRCRTSRPAAPPLTSSCSRAACCADAMRLVVDIGERYLWVDSFCII